MKVKGFSLIEMLMVLSIVAVLLVMATRYYDSATFSQRMNESVQLVQGLKAASTRYKAMMKKGVDSVDTLVKFNLLPATATTTPWGGEVTVSTGSDGKVTATLKDVPQAACQNLAATFGTTTSDSDDDGPCASDPTDFTLTFSP